MSASKRLALLGSSLVLLASNVYAGTPGDALSFEREYVKTISYQSTDSIRLIGFKKITVPQAEVEAFDAAYAQSFSATHKNYNWDKSTGVLTVYFPVESALVEIAGNVVEASTLGELNIERRDDSWLSMRVIGRRQTDKITGVEGNIIKDGIIYLAEKNAPVRHFGQVFVFDFGIKMVMPHNDAAGTDPSPMGGVSCMSNHGGLNCSNAFGIYMGRCPFNPYVCMDYNGWFTNCVNGNTLNFPGSDCDYSLGAGHCWNELM